MLGGIIFLLVIHLIVLGVWLLPRGAWVWLQGRPRDPAAFIRAIPAALVAGWVSFGIVIPILDDLFGKYPAKEFQGLDVLLGLSPFLLVFIPMFFSWPLVLIPPGARTEDAMAEARWFERHPFAGLGIVALVIALAFGLVWVSHH